MSRQCVALLLGSAILLGSCAEQVISPRTAHEPSTEPAPLSNPAEAASVPARSDLPCMATHHGCIALNPDVAQDNIAQTICIPGYTATIRPSTTYTNGVKKKLMTEAGLDKSQMSDYELDHLIPLAVGGHPRKLSNLQLQPWSGENSATEKDGLERRLQRLVCRGDISLADAQYCIAEDWHACQAAVAAGRVLPGGRVVTESVSDASPDQSGIK